MTLLAVERIKLLTTRSPWACAALAVLLSAGLSALLSSTLDDGVQLSVENTQFGYNFAVAIVMVMATLSITTEYRFGTIRSTFLAVPSRAKALVAKAAVAGIAAAVVGEAVAFGSWAVAVAIRPGDGSLAIDSAADWTALAGTGAVFFFAAVIAVAVGTVVRHSAGAISLILIYLLAAESLVRLIPKVGNDIHRWMPFNVAARFLSGPADAGSASLAQQSTSTLSPSAALAYFAGVAVVALAGAIVVAGNRDA